MEVTKELFAIPRGKNYILYAPLEGAILEVQPGVLHFIKQVNSGLDAPTLDSDLSRKLQSARILVKQQPKVGSRENSIYAPTSVTLIPTYNCNLRCVYCYARGGEDVGEVMHQDVARAAIDFIVKNAIERKKKEVTLGFHGGGEPLLPANMDLVKFATEYVKYQAEKNGLRYDVRSASNGVFNNETLEWVVNNLSHVGLSLDGPEDIQNAQRPGINGAPSFPRVMETLKFFEGLSPEAKKTFGYNIRATITAQSVERMTEIVEFFASISSRKSFHLEPLFECGRCGHGRDKTASSSSPDSEVFMKEIIRASESAKKLGKSIYYSGSEIEKIGETFCGACGSNFFVTPEGYVTTCMEACRPGDNVAELFFIGRYNPKSKLFDFNHQKRLSLSERKVSQMSHCENCFAKYNCSGDCPAKTFEESGNISDPSKNRRCIMNRGLLAHRLGQKLDEEKSK